MLLFFIFLLLIVAFLILLERKLLRLIQLRKRPNINRFYGVLQTILDRIKLLIKDFLKIFKAKKFLFIISPFFLLFLSIINWWFIYLYYNFIYLKCSILFNLFVRSIIVRALIWTRWSSNNSYSLLRSTRAVAQIISYEIVISFFIIIFLIKINTYSWYFFYFLNLINFFFFFFISLIIFSAELNRTPFDLVERESELVRRYNVEFTRIIFTVIFLSEYINIWFYSYILVIIFLNVNKIFLVLVIVFFFIFLRAQLPRYKFIDLIVLIWKSIFPLITFFLILFICIYLIYHILMNLIVN